MAGSDRSIAVASLMGMRVASCTYIPAHSKNGQNISAHLLINAFGNFPRRGKEGKAGLFELTLWGKAADVGAKTMSKGKEFNVVAQIDSYQKAVRYNGNVLVDDKGQAVVMNKISFNITELNLGADSNETIILDMKNNLRKLGWSLPGTPEYQQYQAVKKARMSVVFDPRKPTYGHAKVWLPNGPNIGGWIPTAAPTTFPQPEGVIRGSEIEAAIAAAAKNPQPTNIFANLFTQNTPEPTPTVFPVTAHTTTNPAVGFAFPKGI